MRKLLAIATLVIAYAFSAGAETTTFDDRPNCEAQKGVWREYGNGCVDECYPKFDKFTICTSAITFGCDCGKGRCWDDNKCVPIANYKKTFDKNFEAEQKILQEAKKQRQSEYQANTSAMVDKLIEDKKKNGTSVSDVTGAIQNNYNEFYQDNIAPTVDNAVNAANNSIDAANRNLDKAGKEQLPQITLPNPDSNQPTAPPIVINNGNAQVPPLFLEQESNKQKIVPQNPGATQTGATNNNAAPLPIIPLPQ